MAAAKPKGDSPQIRMWHWQTSSLRSSPASDPPLPLLELTLEAGRAARFFGDLITIGVWSPVLDIWHHNGMITIQVELPGLRKKDILVQICAGDIFLRGERHFQATQEAAENCQLERSYGYFWRAITLPPSARTHQLRATLIDGLLTLSIPVPAVRHKASTLRIQPPEPLRCPTG